MPIGFYAISRNEVIEILDYMAENRYGKPSQHSPTFYKLVNHICRDLTTKLTDTAHDFIEEKLVDFRASYPYKG